MDQFIQTIRRPTGYEKDSVALIWERSVKVFPQMKRLCSIVKCDRYGTMGILVRSPKSVEQPTVLLECHIDEVAIKLQSEVKDPKNSISVPVWKGRVMGNSKYHVWGEKVDLVLPKTQTVIGHGFIMQNPPHCSNIQSKQQKKLDDEHVWIRMNSDKTAQNIRKYQKEGQVIVAMFSSKLHCNKQYCIGPGIDNSVSWFIICSVIQRLRGNFSPFLIQLSVQEELGRSRRLFTKREVKSCRYFICLDTDVAESKQIDPLKGLTLYSNKKHWLSQQKNVQLMEKDTVGGTNLDLYSEIIDSSVLLGIPLVGMHSASEQIRVKLINDAVGVIYKFIASSKIDGIDLNTKPTH